MKIFKDKGHSEEVTTLDLGIVEAGSSANFTFYAYNDTQAEVKSLVFKIEDREVKILQAPKELGPKKGGELTLEWKPSVTLKQGLRARLEISGIELWS